MKSGIRQHLPPRADIRRIDGKQPACVSYYYMMIDKIPY